MKPRTYRVRELFFCIAERRTGAQGSKYLTLMLLRPEGGLHAESDGRENDGGNNKDADEVRGKRALHIHLQGHTAAGLDGILQPPSEGGALPLAHILGEMAEPREGADGSGVHGGQFRRGRSPQHEHLPDAPRSPNRPGASSGRNDGVVLLDAGRGGAG